MQIAGEMISSLDFTLRRINSIEQGFNSLFPAQKTENVATSKEAQEFKEILDKTSTTTTTSKQTNVANAQPISREGIEDLIEKYADKNDLDVDFVRAVIKQESGFNPKATSKAGAMGLMQLMPSTARGLGVRDAYNPEENIMGGTKYLKSLMTKFDGNPELALAAYNAGPYTVQKYNGIPPYSETQRYVKNVMANWENLKNDN